MQELLDRATDDWGVKVERVELKDVRLPQQMQRAMVFFKIKSFMFDDRLFTVIVFKMSKGHRS